MIFETPIETERLTLRLLVRGDVERVYAARSRPEVATYLWAGPISHDDAEALVAKRLGRDRLEADDDNLALAVVRREDGLMIGEVTIWLRSAEHRQGEVGAVFHPEGQGRGYAVEAMSGLLDFAFDAAGMHRVAGTADPRNEASVGLMRRLGMRQEALFRENSWFKGAWGDEVVYAILRDEWLASRS